MAITSLSSSLDIGLVRKQFPALRGNTICLNNAGGSLVHKGAIDSVTNSLSSFPLELDGGDEKSDCDIADRRARYVELAAFMNADPDEIAFGPSTTGLLRNLTTSLRPSLSRDSEIIVSVLCHEAGISAWVSLAKSLGVTIKWWMPAGGVGDPNARLTVETLKPLLSPKTRLVTCGHVSNIIGSIHPVRQIADLVHTIPGAMICVDGVAWAPHRQIDVKALDVDFYVFSWYKVFGPHFGQIYARRSTQQRYMTSLNHYFFDPSSLDVKLRLGTNCFELEHCLIPIIRYIHRIGWDSIISHEKVLTEELLAYLTSHADLYTVYGEQTSDPDLRVSLISFIVNGVPTDFIAREIHNTSNCRIGSGDNYSARLVHDILRRGDDGVLRVSLVHYNTIEEVKTFIQILDRVVHSVLN